MLDLTQPAMVVDFWLSTNAGTYRSLSTIDTRDMDYVDEVASAKEES